MPNDIYLYVDGSSCSRGGGWGVVIVQDEEIIGQHRGGELGADATNNRMELMAIMRGLTLTITMPGDNVVIYSDSRYAIQAITTPCPTNHTGEKNKRHGALIRHIQSMAHGRNVEFRWIKGHGLTPRGNRRTGSIAPMVHVKYQHMADGLAGTGRKEMLNRIAQANDSL